MAKMNNVKDEEIQLEVISTDNGSTSKEKQFHSPTKVKGKIGDNDDSSGKNEEDEVQLLPVIGENPPADWTTGFRGAILTGIYFLTCSVVLMFFMNFVHTRMPRDVPPLPDLGHEWVPLMQPENLGDFTMKAMLVMMIIGMVFNKDRWPILTRWMLSLGNLYLLRMVSILVTSLPPTNNHCRTNFTPIPNIYLNTFKGLISFGGANIHCGDLMFSGHTTTATNVWMLFMIYYKKNNLVRFVVTVLLMLTCFFIIATRSHYTADIWIAFWMTSLVHYNTPAYFPFSKRNIIRVVKKWF